MRNVVIFSFLVAVVLVSTCWGQCPNGFPPLPNCNCGLSGADCPEHSFCETLSAVCCPFCRNGPPLLDPSGTRINCGRGGVECPNGSYCAIAPTDAYAVCCRN